MRRARLWCFEMEMPRSDVKLKEPLRPPVGSSKLAEELPPPAVVLVAVPVKAAAMAAEGPAQRHDPCIFIPSASM